MIQSLQLQHVRSHSSSLFSFEPGVNIIIGPNASGKTNALEAIYMLHQAKSFQGSDVSIISYDQKWARIDGYVAGEDRTVKITASPPTKLFEIGDVSYKRLPSRLKLPVVVFDPSHLRMLSGGPEERRKYIDDVLSALNPLYDSRLVKYRRALQQRNRLLKDESINSDHMFAWDIQLCEHASAITAARAEFLHEFSSSALKKYQNISDTEDSLGVSIESKLPIDGYADALAKKLRESFQLDKLRGYTGNGPHRDDLFFELNGHDARHNASRGESRSIVLALKLAEIERLQATSEVKPIFLLDDVFSELDGKRRRMLADTLQSHQSFITTTDADIAEKHFSDSNVIPISNV